MKLLLEGEGKGRRSFGGVDSGLETTEGAGDETRPAAWAERRGEKRHGGVELCCGGDTKQPKPKSWRS